MRGRVFIGPIHRSATVKSDPMHVFSSPEHRDLFLIDFSNLIPPSCHRSCCPLLPDYYSPNTSWPSISLLLQIAPLLHLIGEASRWPSASNSYTSTPPAPHRSLSQIPSPPVSRQDHIQCFRENEETSASCYSHTLPYSITCNMSFFRSPLLHSFFSK